MAALAFGQALLQVAERIELLLERVGAGLLIAQATRQGVDLLLVAALVESLSSWCSLLLLLLAGNSLCTCCSLLLLLAGGIFSRWCSLLLLLLVVAVCCYCWLVESLSGWCSLLLLLLAGGVSF